MPIGTLVATTEAGATYILWMHDDGVRWVRLPGRSAMAGIKTGWQSHLPRVVPGERLMLGPLRSTRVADVAFVPADVANRTAARGAGGYPTAGAVAH